jgi:hypothetical protein
VPVLLYCLRTVAQLYCLCLYCQLHRQVQYGLSRVKL